MGLLFLQHGRWNGRQVVPEEWIDRAMSKQIDNDDGAATHDWTQGYCYQMWVSTPKNSVRLDGAFGQFSIILPEQNAVVAITECTEETQKTLDLVWKHLVPGMSAAPIADDGGDADLAVRLARAEIGDGRQYPRSPLEKAVGGRTYLCETNSETFLTDFERHIESLPEWRIDTIRLAFAGDVCSFVFTGGGHESSVRIGLDGRYRRSAAWLENCLQTIEAVGGWENENTFSFIFRPVELTQANKVTLRFGGSSVTVSWEDTLEKEKTLHGIRGKMA